jgi:hypothetical protein
VCDEGEGKPNPAFYSGQLGLAAMIQHSWVRPVGSWVLESGNVVAAGLAVSLDKPLEWAFGFFFGNTELSLELWTVIAGISEFDD